MQWLLQNMEIQGFFFVLPKASAKICTPFESVDFKGKRLGVFFFVVADSFV